MAPKVWLILVAPALLPCSQPSRHVSALPVSEQDETKVGASHGAPKGWEASGSTHLPLQARAPLSGWEVNLSALSTGEWDDAGRMSCSSFPFGAVFLTVFALLHCLSFFSGLRISPRAISVGG